MFLYPITINPGGTQDSSDESDLEEDDDDRTTFDDSDSELCFSRDDVTFVGGDVVTYSTTLAPNGRGVFHHRSNCPSLRTASLTASSIGVPLSPLAPLPDVFDRRKTTGDSSQRRSRRKGRSSAGGIATFATASERAAMLRHGFVIPKDRLSVVGSAGSVATLTTLVPPPSPPKPVGKVRKVWIELRLRETLQNKAKALNAPRLCRKMAKFLTPHIVLATLTAVYLLLGALVFQTLEEDHLDDLTETNRLRVLQGQQTYLNRLWQLTQLDGVTKDDAKLLIRGQYENYVESVYTAHRYHPKEHKRSDSERRALVLNGTFTQTRWTYETAVFFTTTMLTSIGYGFIVPYTTWGRLFSCAYGIVGVPLTLVSVANIAKFFSEVLFWIHHKCLVVWYKWKFRDKREDEEIEGILGGGTIAEILDRTRLVRFPSVIMFLLIIGYGWLAAHLIGETEPEWTFLESLYFTFISILTVGFGDYKPNPENWIYSFSLVVIGVVFGTMCMDTVGSFYLREIHYLGRQLRETSNPFDLIRQAKDRRRRKHMTGMLKNLAKGLVFTNSSAISDNTSVRTGRRRRKRKKRRRPSLSDQAYMFARQAPDPPVDFVVVSTSAQSARLRWNPAFSHTTADVTYDIRYRVKLEETSDVRVVCNITACQYEVTELQSCSLYEFCISAVNQFGSSKKVVAVQYTEPAISPQHIIADKLSANCIRLSWEAPLLRSAVVKHYVVYYTDDCHAELSEWKKLVVYEQHVVFDNLRYDWFYQFSVRAVFLSDDPNSPLSRALFVKTDILDFNPHFIGHSQTVEIMEALSQRHNERTPLIREATSFGGRI